MEGSEGVLVRGRCGEGGKISEGREGKRSEGKVRGEGKGVKGRRGE